MGSRDLFDKGKPHKILKTSDVRKTSKKVESSRNIAAQKEERQRFVPQIDYSDPNNFARFGSAEKYYEDAFDRVLADYPYDGSEAEITEYLNSSSYLDLYVLENEYPRTTGFITIHAGGYTPTAGISGWKAVATAAKEYITIKGGPHTASGGMASGSMAMQFTGANYYDTDIYDTAREIAGDRKGSRLSNLRYNLEDGVTVEFWLKKDSWQTSNTDNINKTAIFDLWNGEITGTNGQDNTQYGRLLLFLSASGHGDEGAQPFGIHLASGSTVWDARLGASITTSSIEGNWEHFAFTFQSSSADSTLKARLYRSGSFVEEVSSGDIGNFNEVTGSLVAHLGALQTTPSGNAFQAHVYPSTTYKGYGGLEASMDEFRFWKVARTGEDIGLNYFTQVRGGTNTDTANTDLGVYYKFNEGTTGTSSIDSIVLDYSGRISNGVWTGYPGSTARNTGSAIVSASAATSEFEDPIIRIDNTLVTDARTTLVESGSVYDYTSNSNLYNRVPGWIQDEDPGTLKQLVQIMTSYMDSLHLQMEELPNLKDNDYVSGSNKPLPVANRLVANYGMQAPEIFADAEILSQIMSRDEVRNFELEIGGIKDRIYKNIYNNLVYIYKSKGSLKSFRNLIRCYGVDDNVVSLNLYANNTEYKVRDNYDPAVVRKKYVDFNYPDSWAGVVTQQSQSSNVNASNVTFISGTVNEYLATTAEVEVLFPKKVTDRASAAYYNATFLSSSIAGTHVLNTQGDDDCFVQVAVANDAAWGLYAVKIDSESPDAYFVFKSHRNSTPDFYLTSSVYPSLYDNEKWNFAVRTRNAKYPVSDRASGSHAGSATDYDVDDTYTVLELYGVNYEGGVLKNELYLTSSAISNTQYLTSDRRYYMGAQRTNWTGSVVQRSDVKASSLRHWESYVEDAAIRAHARDPKNFGSLRPYQSAYLMQTVLTGTIVPEFATLTFNWDFENVTGSDSDGEFLVLDRSSGSIDNFGRYHDNENNPQFSKTIAYQYPGRAYDMRTSTTGVIDRAYISAERQNAPESISAQDTVSILTLQDEVQFTRDSRPVNYYFSFEKSMYATITQEIMNFFGSVVAFNELIGDPKNRYRQDYKELGKLRELFFEKIGNTPDLDKYVDYYKWIDNSLSVMLQQLVPATADFSEGIRTMVESHVLERNKYWSKFPTLEMKVTDPEAAVRGITELKYDWEHGHAPLGLDDEAENCMWWKERAERTTPLISSSVASVNTDREAQREIIETYRTGSPGPTLAQSTKTLPTTTYQGSTYALRRFDEIYNLVPDESPLYHGGPDYSQRKRYGFITPQIRTFPIASDNNITLIDAGSPDYGKDCDDAVVPPELDKKKVSYAFETTNKSAILGGPYEDIGVGDIYSPFSVYSSSVQTGYQNSPIAPSAGSGKLTDVVSGGISNMHHDIIGNDMEVPMQGPFTEKYVGGNQWRHQDLVHDPATTGSSNGTKRAEGFLLQAQNDNSLRLIAPTSHTAAGLRRPYAVYTRDEAAKRPVNIRNIQMTASDIGAYKTTLPAGTGTPIGPTPTEFISGTLRSNIGNFENFYDIVQTSGRSINNAGLTENDGFSKTTVSPSAQSYTQQVVGTLKPQRGKHEHVFVQRFSAPGGPDTAGDANGGFGLDFESAEFSPYNALPFRNTSVRTPLNRTLLTRHARQFGIYNDAATADLALDPLTAPRLTGSYHKTNRNTLNRIVFGGTADYSLGEQYATPETGSFRDNGFISHEIPRMETSYAWITSSLVQSLAYGHGHPEGIYSNSSGIHSSIDFVSSSDIVSYLHGSGVRRYGADYLFGAGASSSPFHQVTHLNANIVEPLSASEATLGYETTTPAGFYINYGNIDTMPNTAVNNESFIQSALNNSAVTASVLHDLNIYRNGYYGYPSWKQTRTAENKLVRHYRKNNTITINPTPGSARIISGFGRIKDRFGSLQSFEEPPVDYSSRPLHYVLGVESGDTVKTLTINATYGNDLTRFSNRGLDDLTFSLASVDTPYDTLKKTYLNNAMESETSPVKRFFSLQYRQDVYPAAYNVGMEKVRERENFKVKFWDNTRSSRTTLGSEKSSSMGAPYFGLFNQLTQSAWAMDASQVFEAGAIKVASTADESAAGELQNDYLQVHNGSKAFITASVLYSRKHMLFSTSSTVPVLLDNPQTGGVANTVDPSRRQGDIAIYGGTALWEAATLAGRVTTEEKIIQDADGNKVPALVKSFESDVRYPIEPDYEKNMADAILQSQRYSIIPEFRISKHMELYGTTQDFLIENDQIFEIYGASGSLPSSSAEQDFYKTYSNSDFMKHFETLYEDHTDFRKPTKITLRCKAIKKFLPYDGFYPAQRTIDLATQFSKSYGAYINVDGGIDGFASEASSYPKAAIRPLLQPMFAPGILYNTIKSGIAVDYGMYTGSYEVVNNSGSQANAGELFFVGRPISIDGKGRGTSERAVGFDKRVPFEAIVSPLEHIANETFVDMEPHPSASMNLTASWSGQGDPLYSMMASNFLAESINMFMPNGQMSSFVSAKESEFDSFEPGKVYAMRIKMRKSFNQPRTFEANSKNTYPFPQVRPEETDTGLRETFTMYSRPSAFGPPLSGRRFDTGSPVNIGTSKADPLSGYNPAYTPPYYDGEGWCDIIFKAELETHTLADIQEKAKVSHWRIDNLQWTYASPSAANDLTMPYDRGAVKGYAMQVTASLNVLGQAQVNSIEYDADTGRPILISDAPASNEPVWVIEPKFETPMFNFTPTSGALRPITEADGNLTIPTNGKETVPRGMWHQFGLPPSSPDEGIFMELTDIPKQWAKNRLSVASGQVADDYYKTETAAQDGFESLIDKLKFTNTKTRLGEVKQGHTVSEAIVAVPFIVDGGTRNFFEIDRATIDQVIIGDPISGDPVRDYGDSISTQVDMMRKYVIPPTFNFLDFPDSVDPVAMYFFEFSHTFDKEDLSYIWQNLPPKAGTKIEMSESSITHPLLTNELMGKTGGETGRAIQNELQWMVFKVKQKANVDYYGKRLVSVGTDKSVGFEFSMGGKPASLEEVKYSYNWPYDFFSLVEFANIESEISFENPPEVPNESYLPELTAEQAASFESD
jgi:hypothetical protein